MGKDIEMCKKRIRECNEHLDWFDLKIALSVYTPEEIIEHKNWWKEDRDWWQKELEAETHRGIPAVVGAAVQARCEEDDTRL